ncbi:MAG: hypothetical protein ACRD2R_07070, partial [Terriglobales bacterium]
MTLKTFVISSAIALALLLFAQHRSETPAPPGYSSVVDLTQPESEKFPNWEGTEKSPFEARELGN